MSDSLAAAPDAPYLTDAANRRFALGAQPILLGRSDKCAVYIADARASRPTRANRVGWRNVHADRSGQRERNVFETGGASPRRKRCAMATRLRSRARCSRFTTRMRRCARRICRCSWVDARSGEIWVNRKPVSLSPKEQALFDLLYRNAGKPISKQQIAEAVWPEYAAQVYDYQIESLVKRLREKIEPDPANPALIVTMHGRGYKLVV
jgi:hypothetical protein